MKYKFYLVFKFMKTFVCSILWICIQLLLDNSSILIISYWRSHKLPTNVPQNSHKGPTNVPQRSHKRPTNFPQTSHKGPTNVPQSSHKRPTKVPQRSHKLPTKVPQTSHKRPTNVPQTSHKGPTNVPQTSHKRPTSVPQASHKGPTNVPLTSHWIWLTGSSVPSNANMFGWGIFRAVGQDCRLRWSGHLVEVQWQPKISCCFAQKLFTYAGLSLN